MSVLGYFTVILGSMLYAVAFKSWEFRNVTAISSILGLLNGLCGVAFITSIYENIGISDKVFWGIQTMLFDSLWLAVSDLPMMVMFAKLTPK